MKVHANFLDYLAFSIFFFNLYQFLVIPFSYLLFDFIHYVQIFLFLIFFSYNFKFDTFFNFKLPRFKGINVLYYLLFGVFLFSSFYINFNVNINIKSILKLISYPLIVYIFFFYLPRRMYAENEMFEFCLKAILYFAVFDSIYSIANNFLNFQPNLSFPGHLIGLFYHPNMHAFLFSISIPILFYFYFTKKINSAYFILILILFLYVLLNTFSRAGFMTVGLGVLIITFFRSKKLFLIALAITIFATINVFLIISESKTDSSLSRGLLLLTAIQMIMVNGSVMFFGYGVFESLEIFRTEKVFLGSLEIVLDPHNWFLLMGIQFGIIVPTLCLIIFIIIVYRVFKNLNLFRAQNNYFKVAVSITIALSLFFQNLFEDLLVYPEFFVMPIFLFFMGYLCLNLRNFNLLQVE